MSASEILFAEDNKFSVPSLLDLLAKQSNQRKFSRLFKHNLNCKLAFLELAQTSRRVFVFAVAKLCNYSHTKLAEFALFSPRKLCAQLQFASATTTSNKLKELRRAKNTSNVKGDENLQRTREDKTCATLVSANCAYFANCRRKSSSDCRRLPKEARFALSLPVFGAVTLASRFAADWMLRAARALRSCNSASVVRRLANLGRRPVKDSRAANQLSHERKLRC